MVVFVLRHADRKPNPDDDLTLAGIERVKLLVRMFTETRVSALFAANGCQRRTLESSKQRLGNALTGGVLNAEISHLYKLTNLCFKRGKYSIKLSSPLLEHYPRLKEIGYVSHRFSK